MRSLLLVRIGDGAAVEAAFRSEADALVLHLGDDGQDQSASDAAENAGALMRSLADDERRPQLFVRLADLDAPWFDRILKAIVGGEPDGILLAGSRNGADVQHLGAKLAVAEAEGGLTLGTVGVIASIDHAGGLFGLGSYAGASPRLVGLAWDAAALASDLGGEPQVSAQPGLAPLDTARHLILFAARAATVAAIDTASGPGDPDGFLARCRAARQQGFNAKLAWTPQQAVAVNAAFGYDDAA